MGRRSSLAPVSPSAGNRPEGLLCPSCGTESTICLTVPTIRFQILYVFLVLAHERRRILHFAVTAHPTAEWTAHQLREAFPWDTAPRYLLRDRDRIFGQDFVDQVKAMGIKQVLSAPRSPWQRAYVERVIGTLRRECFDHVIVFNQASLSHHLPSFLDYYNYVSYCPISLCR
jgi:putative transposase